MEVTREEVEFKPITVSFVIEDVETLERITNDFQVIGRGAMNTYSITDELCEAIAYELSRYLED